MLFGDFGKQSNVRANLFDLLVTKHDLAQNSWFFLTAISRVKWDYFRGGKLVTTGRIFFLNGVIPV